MLDKEELKTTIETLRGILRSLEEFTPCSKCSRPAVARGKCSKHYNQWRREFCRELQVKKLGDVTPLPEPDPRQAQLFSDTDPLGAPIDQLFRDLEF